MSTSPAVCQQNMPFCQWFHPAQSVLPEFGGGTFSCWGKKKKKKSHVDLKEETWAELLPDSCRMKWEGGLIEEVFQGPGTGPLLTLGCCVCSGWRVQALWHFLSPGKETSRGTVEWSTLHPSPPHQADLDKKSPLMPSGYCVRRRRKRGTKKCLLSLKASADIPTKHVIFKRVNQVKAFLLPLWLSKGGTWKAFGSITSLHSWDCPPAVEVKDRELWLGRSSP